MRTAVALNSEVPANGSMASIVSSLVAICSGKCSVMNARPTCRPASKRTGAVMAPRREVTRTRSPSARPSRRASDG